MHRSLLAAAAALLLFVPLSASAQDDVGAASEAICCGGECCLIAGTCYARGDNNPADSCEVCDPSMSGSSFSAVAGCAPADTGTPTTDAGTTTPPDDGGGCSVSPGSSSGAGLAFGLFALGALFVRRRLA